MADVNTEDDVETGAGTTPTPPAGPSAFSDSQTPWENPMEKAVSSMPPIDYAQAVKNRQAVGRNEIADVERITRENNAANQRLAANAEAKNAEIQAADPREIRTWNAQAKQEQYSTSPIEAFGSFAMIAALGMSAFTKSPMTASLNAMAGVMNGIKEGNDQAYERDYNAWKANTDVMMKRFGVLKDQLSSDMEVWKAKGAQGQQNLSNTLAKYGLYKDQALVDAGLVEPVETAMVARLKAVEGMRKAAEEIETQHSIRRAIDTEEAQRKELGLPPTTPQEQADIKAGIESPGTPAEQSFRDAWRKFHQEEPNADSERMAEKRQELQYSAKSNALRAADELVESHKGLNISEGDKSVIRSAMGAKGVRAAAGVARINEILDQAEAKAAAGTPLSPAELSEGIRKATIGVQAEGVGTGVDQAARKWITDGKPIQGTAAFKEQVQARAAKLNEEEHIVPPDEMFRRQQLFAAQQGALKSFLSGPQGNTVRSISVVMDHLATIDELGMALKNGNLQLANRLRQAIATQAGHMEPTNVDVATRIVGPELIKSLGIVAGGTGEERREAALNWSTKASPEQFLGASDTARKLLSGQLVNIRRQFRTATGQPEEIFDSMLSPMAKEGLRGRAAEENQGLPPAIVEQLKEGVVSHITSPSGAKSDWTLKGGVPTKLNGMR